LKLPEEGWQKEHYFITKAKILILPSHITFHAAPRLHYVDGQITIVIDVKNQKLFPFET